MDDELLFRSLIGATDASEEARLVAWRRADPANEERYQQAAAMHRAGLRADARRAGVAPPSVSEIIEASVAQFRDESLPAKRGRAWRRWAVRLVAAAAMLTLGFVAAEFRPHSQAVGFGVDEFVTGPAETATVSLLDGSVVRLASGSRLRLARRPNLREVALTGQAYFAVAKQNGRPFRISTSAGDVTVLGTRFALEAERENLRLVVVEGQVSLSSQGRETKVSAGEVGRIVKGTQLPVEPAPDVGSLVGWVGNFLAFNATPLVDAAHEIERQFKVRIALTDSVLSRRTITGWFAGWSVDEVMDVVCVIANATCSRQGDVVTMRPRATR